MADLRWLRRAGSSIRVRSTVLSVLLTALVLSLGAALLLFTYRAGLVGNLDATLEQQAADRVRLLDSGSEPQSLTVVQREESFVWIGTADGDLVAQGGSLLPLENPVRQPVGTTVNAELRFVELHDGESEEERHKLRLTSASTTDGLVVVAGSELEGVDGDLGALTRLFALAVPIIAALVGALAWFVTGRALRPVANIRARAMAIDGATLSERVPVPPAEDEIHDLAVTVNAMLERIDSHEVKLRRFSADASHELKSPIANVRAMVDTAEIDDPAWPATRDRLSGETDRMRDVVDNLLYLAAHRDGPEVSYADVVQLDEVLFAEAEIAVATGGMRLDLSGVRPAEALGSTADVSRLVRNLVDNAVRHADTTVWLSSFSHGAGAGIVVADDGAGIPSISRDEIFERFTRLDEARDRDGGGSGLGLNIVRQIAVNHGAEISVADHPTGGAEFRVTFPPTPE